MPTINVLSKNKKIVKNFQMKIVFFTGVKNRCMLHGRVLVVQVCLSVPQIHVRFFIVYFNEMAFE